MKKVLLLTALVLCSTQAQAGKPVCLMVNLGALLEEMQGVIEGSPDVKEEASRYNKIHSTKRQCVERLRTAVPSGLTPTEAEIAKIRKSLKGKISAR